MFFFLNIFIIKIPNIESFFLIYSEYLMQFLILSNIIYFLGIFGIMFNQRNLLITMLFIEVTYVGIFLYFIGISVFLNSPIGQIYALIILITAACESAIGLGLLLVIFKNDFTVNYDNFQNLKG